MKKIDIEVTEEDLKILQKESKYNAKLKVRNKAKVLLMRSIGNSYEEIKNKTDITPATIVSYVKAFNKNGISSIYTTNYKGQPSKLKMCKNEIIKEFESNPPQTREEAVVKVKELFGIETSITAIGRFLKKMECHTKSQEASQQKQKKNNNRYSWTLD